MIRGCWSEAVGAALPAFSEPEPVELGCFIALTMGLLGELREAGAHEQAAALAGRLPGAGMFKLFCEQEDGQDRFRFGRETDGSPARPWAGKIWTDAAGFSNT